MSATVSTPASSASSSVLSSDAKLARVRELMLSERIDAFIIPTDDPHMSEYTAPHFGRREFVSGFTGSAGTAVVLRDSALLFTDGRYHNQAELELQGSSWTLMKQGLKDVPNFPEFLANSLTPGSVVGYDPLLHAAAPLKRMQDTLAKKNLQLKALASNLVDPVWGASRPPAPQGKLRIHGLQHAGKSVADKLADIRAALMAAGANALVLTTLDEIAWVFNIRGSDVPCNPVSVAYAMITTDGNATLFIDAGKVPQNVAAELLAGAGVTTQPYEEALPAVQALDRAAAEKGGLIWVDGRTVNMGVYNAVNPARCIDRESPVTLMKACKNEAELAGMRACHIRDGAAMAEFFAWLEEELTQPGRTISEVEVDERVTASRASFGQWLEPSFPTIAGVNSNGAIVHYRAIQETCKQLTNNDMMLLDSGGQYLDGTTDVTRTFHTGAPSAHQREMFTRVLKGHIGLDSRVFPTGTAGCFLDSFAREHLWAIGKDYIHGTGHGVGKTKIEVCLAILPFIPSTALPPSTQARPSTSTRALTASAGYWTDTPLCRAWSSPTNPATTRTTISASASRTSWSW